MDITYKNKKGIEIKAKKAKILFAENEEYKGDEYDIVITKELKGKGFCVSMPGEYEVSGISVLAQSSSLDEKVDVIEVLIGGSSVLLLRPGFKYSKSIHDNLGEIHVLVAQIGKKDGYKDLVKKFDPEILIPFGPEDAIEGLLDKLDINDATQTKKISFRSSQFGKDEFDLETYTFEK